MITCRVSTRSVLHCFLYRPKSKSRQFFDVYVPIYQPCCNNCIINYIDISKIFIIALNTELVKKRSISYSYTMFWMQIGKSILKHYFKYFYLQNKKKHLNCIIYYITEHNINHIIWVPTYPLYSGVGISCTSVAGKLR